MTNLIFVVARDHNVHALLKADCLNIGGEGEGKCKGGNVLGDKCLGIVVLGETDVLGGQLSRGDSCLVGELSGGQMSMVDRCPGGHLSRGTVVLGTLVGGILVQGDARPGGHSRGNRCPSTP